jgi:adenine deaminase
MQIRGQLVQIIEQKIDPVEIGINNGIITSITPLPLAADGALDPAGTPAKSAPFILPGFIDAHVHIESSLLIPSEFARLAGVHGTIATVSDPHEIANVCGLPGVEFMVRNGRTVPFYFFFGAPSCVPATNFETAGATLDVAAVTHLLENPEIRYLSEMMNFPGVLNKDPEVMEKIAVAHRLGKPVDGHAPGLKGAQAKQYIDAGISTDHECFTAEEALDKLKAGMKILIREGSAAKNFEALIPLLKDWPEQMMFCSDDKHPDSLLAGHIDRLCARALAHGVPLFHILRAACINPADHYGLPTGRLRVGDPADFILVEDLKEFKVRETYIKGQLIAANGQTKIPPTPQTETPINNFKAKPRELADFAYPLDKWGEQENVEQCYCIGVIDGQLITDKLIIPVADALPRDGRLHGNPEKDVLKIVVVDRYQSGAPVAKSFIKGFGLKQGAIAASVAHDSHNIVAIGADDESLCRAVNLIIGQKGGLACIAPANSGSGQQVSARELVLPLPVAGLMSPDDGYHIANAYIAIDKMAKELGSTLAAPFMTLSFMALLVIPHLKLSDLGLFDGDQFRLL